MIWIFFDQLSKNFRPKKGIIALPEINDPRVQEARLLLENGVTDAIAVPNDAKIQNSDFITYHELSPGTEQRIFHKLEAKAKAKGRAPDKKTWERKAASPLWQAATCLGETKCSAVVAGCVYTTAEVIGAALGELGSRKGSKNFIRSLLDAYLRYDRVHPQAYAVC